MSEIRDKSLAASGEQKIAWARRNMPLLNSIEKEFSIPFETQEAMRNLRVQAKKGCGTCASEPELVG